MSNEEDLLFQAGSNAKSKSATFTRSAPSPKELASAVSKLDLEDALGLGAEVTTNAAVKSKPTSSASNDLASTPMQFAARETPPSAPSRTNLDATRKRAQRGPIAIDEKRIELMERPSLITRFFRTLARWFGKS